MRFDDDDVRGVEVVAWDIHKILSPTILDTAGHMPHITQHPFCIKAISQNENACNLSFYFSSVSILRCIARAIQIS